MFPRWTHAEVPSYSDCVKKKLNNSHLVSHQKQISKKSEECLGDVPEIHSTYCFLFLKHLPPREFIWPSFAWKEHLALALTSFVCCGASLNKTLSGYLYESEIGEANLAFTRLRYSVKRGAGAAPRHLERWRAATLKVGWGKRLQ